MKVMFRSNLCEYESNAFFKNKYKLGCLIPEMLKLGQGVHEISIDISVNGLQFFPTNHKIHYNSKIIFNEGSEFGLSVKEIMKLDEQELKSKDKGKPKPKK